MRYSFALILAAVTGLIALTPSESQAGPFIYRGGAWDRYVAPVVNGGYYYDGGYWSNGIYYGPTYSSFYYPSTTYVAPATVVAPAAPAMTVVPAAATTIVVPAPATTLYFPATYYYDTPVWYGRVRWRR